MDLNIVNNQEKFLAGKLEGYTLKGAENKFDDRGNPCLLYTSPSPRDPT